ncbi:hypothetical protein [Erythrobacter aureus]|uniref:Uncharacterized protein n=1 Tax=Erythrobacter aureus TaxID=2182384 RepID=A0A345YIP7_9SPHN|nr:hypothetical protein [Erythrobacter aureus]AXK43799.1 hypothetical protein DVR09_15190 [Erythrobacter aureus]
MNTALSALSLRPLSIDEVAAPCSMEHMAAMVSDNENLDSQGYRIILVRAYNNGGGSRWASLSGLGDEMLNELRENEAAYSLVKEDEFNKMLNDIDFNLMNEQLLTVDVRLYKLGELVARYSNEEQ